MPENYPFISDKNKHFAGPYKGISIDEESFFEWLKQFEGSDYYNQYLNAYNTYKSQNFNPNFFQSLGWEAFGDSSPWNNFENSRLTTFFDAISRIQDAQHQESYNSTVQQVQRERQAGINPDLAGNVTSGEAGNLDNLETPLPAPAGPENIMGEVASSAMQVVSLGMSLAQSFQGLQAGDLEIMLGSLDLKEKSDNSILSSLGNFLSESDIRILLDPYAEDINKKRKFSDDDRLRASGNLHSALDMLVNDKRLPSSLRKRLRRSMLTLPSSGSINADSSLYKLISDTYEHKKGAVSNAGHPFTSGGFESCLTMIGDHIQKTVLDIEKLNAKIANKDAELQDKRLGVEGRQLQFEFDRLSQKGPDGSSLGTLAGKSDAAAYDAEAYQKEYDSIVNKMWDDIMKDLQYGNDKDKWWSKLLRFAIPIVRLWLGNIKMPSVSHSTSTGIGTNGKPVQNSSTSFGW